MSSAPPIRIGVLGLGLAGSTMAAAISDHSEFVLVAGADLNSELRTKFCAEYGVAVESTAECLIARKDIEAIYIATPHQFHCEHLLLAARHGKHAIVEKPMALSLSDCDEMIKAADRNNIILIVGHTHSFDPAIRRIRSIVKSGELGRLAMIATWNYTNFIYRPRRPEELDTAQGGGIVFNQLPHQVDIVRAVATSPVKTVRATTAILDSDRPTEGTCAAFLGFDDGAAASIVYSGYDRFDSNEMHSWISESGQKTVPSHGKARKSLKLLSGRDAERQARVERSYKPRGDIGPQTPQYQPHFGTVIVSCERGDLVPTASGIHRYTDSGCHEESLEVLGAHAGFRSVLDEAFESIRLGNKPIHDGEFARGTLEVCLTILRSSRERREIALR